VAAREITTPNAPLLARVPSPALVVAAIASVQFGSATAATLFDSVGPGGAVLLRLATAAIVLLVLWRPPLRGHSATELRLACVFGLVLVGMNLCFYEALHRIPLGIAVSLEFVGPLGVAVAGSRNRRDAVWIVLAAAGILTLTRARTHGIDGLGIAFALAAGSLWGTYILVNARVGSVFEGSTGLALAMAVAAIVAIPVGIADGGGHLLEPSSLALGAVVGILSSAIPYSFELEALRRIAPPVFGVLMSLEPAMAALAGFIVLGQSLSARALVGMALVTAASIGASRSARADRVAVQ
jgi:inner membrane transporter RhtA